MRRKALESDIIIVNHHLFFADLALKREATGAPDAGILPDAAAVVFDEAHELEDVASSYFGLSVSNIRFEELARDTDVLLRGKEGAENLPAQTQQLRDRARMFFAGLPMAGDGRQPFTEREEFLETSGDLYTAVRATLRRMEAEMEGLKGIDEAPGLKKRVARLRSELEFLLESSASNMVYWMERRMSGGASSDKSTARNVFRPQARTTFLQATPIDVSE
ncbi:MAG: ATP-dependent DNA helicase, partial [Terracidiphilus sp.]